jgi:lambda repressor-like predicted transcriptional regulator
MSNRSLIRGEVTKAERIRELLAKGLPSEVIAVRVGVKPSEIWRVRQKATKGKAS